MALPELWTFPSRWAAVAAAGCLGAVLLLAVEVPPRAGRLLALEGQRAAAEARLATAQTWASERTALRAERVRLEEAFAALALDRPRDGEASAVLSALQDAAEAAGLTLGALRPLERERGNAYDRLPVELEVQGRFPGVVAFLRAVEASATPMRVREVAVEAVDPTAADVEAEVLLDVLTLKAPEGADQGAAPGLTAPHAPS